jgi:hypothetical protein
VPINAIQRVAVADAIAISPAERETSRSTLGTHIDAAYGSPNDSTITVSFVDSPERGGTPCGADYTAEVVESDLAIVVIVRAHGTVGGGACSAVGATRTASVSLAAPLGERTILDAQLGVPITLEPGPPPPDAAHG